MNNFSVRWLFVAVAGSALAVTAILNSNELWLAGSRFVLVMLIGMAAARSLSFGREAPWSFGFAVCAVTANVVQPSFDLGGLNPDLGLSFYQEALLVDHSTALIYGCLGGFLCETIVRRSKGPLPLWPGLFVLPLLVLLFAVAVAGAAWVKV